MGKTFRSSFMPLLFSLLFGGLWAIIGGALYHILVNVLGVWGPIVVAGYLTGLAIMLFLAIIVSNAVGGNAKPKMSGYIKSLIAIALIFVLSLGFEFIYELDSLDIKLPKLVQGSKDTSYIFLIDNSGSMNSNDPDKKVNDAIYNIMSECDKDFPYAVYGYGSADECKQVEPMRKASKAKKSDNYADYYSGWNDIMSGIELILDDIDSGELDAGKNPKIIILADGDDNGKDKFDDVMERCNDKNIVISTIGFGDAMKYYKELEDHLKNIAEATGGEYVRAEDADELSTAVSTAARGGSAKLNTASRTLLGYRSLLESGSILRHIILGVMRVIFLGILAACFVFIKIFLYSTVDQKNVALITFIVLAVVGTLLMEFGMLLGAVPFIGGITPHILRVIMCFCYTILFGTPKGKGSSGQFDFIGDKTTTY